MKILLIILSGVLLVSNEKNIDKTQLEAITKTKVVEQYKIIPKEIIKQKMAENMQKQVIAKKTTTKKKKTKKKVVKKTKKKVVKKKTTKVSYSKSEIQSYAYSLVKSYGWSDTDWNAFVQIINHESGWRVTAENPKSHAYGLCQSLPGNKMASVGSDWRTNYKTQLKWCMGYIKGRYGSPSNAWNFWQSHHWY